MDSQFGKTLQVLPDELYWIIFAFCDFITISKLALTNKTYYKAILSKDRVLRLIFKTSYTSEYAHVKKNKIKMNTKFLQEFFRYTNRKLLPTKKEKFPPTLEPEQQFETTVLKANLLSFNRKNFPLVWDEWEKKTFRSRMKSFIVKGTDIILLFTNYTISFYYFFDLDKPRYVVDLKKIVHFQGRDGGRKYDMIFSQDKTKIFLLTVPSYYQSFYWLDLIDGKYIVNTSHNKGVRGVTGASNYNIIKNRVYFYNNDNIYDDTLKLVFAKNRVKPTNVTIKQWDVCKDQRIESFDIKDDVLILLLTRRKYIFYIFLKTTRIKKCREFSKVGYPKYERLTLYQDRLLLLLCNGNGLIKDNKIHSYCLRKNKYLEKTYFDYIYSFIINERLVIMQHDRTQIIETEIVKQGEIESKLTPFLYFPLLEPFKEDNEEDLQFRKKYVILIPVSESYDYQKRETTAMKLFYDHDLKKFIIMTKENGKHPAMYYLNM